MVINSQLCVASSLSENSVENYEVLGVKADRQEREDRLSFFIESADYIIFVCKFVIHYMTFCPRALRTYKDIWSPAKQDVKHLTNVSPTFLMLGL